MSNLDDLFTDALERSATLPRDEDLAVVADATVRGARRKQRKRTGLQAAALVLVLGAGIALGSRVGGADGVPPAATPTPPPVAVSDATADPRMPQVPLVTADEWARVDDTWDMEAASFVNTAEGGSALAMYLTPPGGERVLAYADADFPLNKPVMLAWNASERQAVFMDEDTNEVWFLYVDRGVAWPTNSNLYTEGIDGGWPLGRSSAGYSYFVFTQESEPGERSFYIQYLADNGYLAPEISDDGWNPNPVGAVSTVWGDMIIVDTEDGLSVLRLGEERPAAERDHPLPNTRTCTFDAWTFEGTFIAECNDDADVVEINPATGEQQPYDVTSRGLYAIDSTRAWAEWSDTGLALGTPPLVYEAAPAVTEPSVITDLRDGFSHVPTNYAVIFGVRGH